MRHSTPMLLLAVAGAFVAGLSLAPPGALPIGTARADPAPLAPAVIDLLSIAHADLAATPYPDLRARPLVTTDFATIGLQSGNVAKHVHPKTDEIQYIVEGSGSMWIGGERKDFRPGTLLVIPKGTAHAGALVTTGPVKAIAIKIPPQPRDDVVFVE